MFYGRKLKCNAIVNEEYQEIQFLWNGHLRTMRFQMFQDSITKQLLFKIAANVPRFKMEEIAIVSSNTDVNEIEYHEIPGGFGDMGTRVFKSDHPIHDVVHIIYLYFEV